MARNLSNSRPLFSSRGDRALFTLHLLGECKGHTYSSSLIADVSECVEYSHSLITSEGMQMLFRTNLESSTSGTISHKNKGTLLMLQIGMFEFGQRRPQDFLCKVS